MRAPDTIVSDWYAGEVGGVALFSLLASRAPPHEATKWLALQSVEARMSVHLAGVLTARGIPLPDTSHMAQRAHDRCEPLQNQTWLQLMQWLHRIADAALQSMSRDASTLPADLADVGALVVAHEVALVEFAVRELDVNGGGEFAATHRRIFGACRASTARTALMNKYCVGMLLGALGGFAQAYASPGPSPAAGVPPIAAPKDRPYPGEIQLRADASDLNRRIVRVRETISGVARDTVLLYPQWLPGTHAPEGTLDRLAGIKITAGGVPVSWTRDTVDVFAFHVHVPAGAGTIEVEFQYLSPTSEKTGEAQFSQQNLILEWNSLILYPAGYFTRQIPVQVDLKLPAGWKFGSALESANGSDDSPSFKKNQRGNARRQSGVCGRVRSTIGLDPGAKVPVHLNVFAERPELLAVTPEQLAAHRSLVQQAYKLYGSHHYDHYDFLYSLSDQVEKLGLEHHQSSEDGATPEMFTEWDKKPAGRDLLAHEYTHSWNGKFRRPADLWTPNFNVPMRDTLLWVYEGQTQFWGEVLAARSGLWTKEQTLDALAMTAAYYETLPGKEWRPMQDTTNDEIIDPRRPLAWRDWQRFEDYYEEGKMIWLDADTLIRERSQGKRSLDDFAKAFFGINDGSFVPVTYTFDDVVKTLNAVEPYEWATFLRERLDAVNKPAPLDGIRRGGYKLVFTDAPSGYAKAVDDERKRVSLTYSLGISVDSKNGTIMAVRWNTPAFVAGLTEGNEILAVNGTAYSDDLLKDAVTAAKGTNKPIELMIKNGNAFRVIDIAYHDGLRFPHLERDTAVPARLDDLLAPK